MGAERNSTEKCTEEGRSLVWCDDGDVDGDVGGGDAGTDPRKEILRLCAQITLGGGRGAVVPRARKRMKRSNEEKGGERRGVPEPKEEGKKGKEEEEASRKGESP
ncbi:hypothetical protein HZH66_009615 [Vespula vulgaris]|uniref:Uncharacterized protein n=1 Tax=Vespula vulgaris TaxID=7454 RepID=A0A834JNB0_VESVU|nr:hypothetical protein HZH66_009615 [Vespula vulgaris]